MLYALEIVPILATSPLTSARVTLRTLPLGSRRTPAALTLAIAPALSALASEVRSECPAEDRLEPRLPSTPTVVESVACDAPDVGRV